MAGGIIRSVFNGQKTVDVLEQKHGNPRVEIRSGISFNLTPNIEAAMEGLSSLISNSNPLTNSIDDCLPAFVGAHMRRATFKETKQMNSTDYVKFDASESLSTITADHFHSQVFDMVVDSRHTEDADCKLDELWTEQLQPALFSRLEHAKHAAFVTVGPNKSGKSSILIGEEVDLSSPEVGVVPRFIRAVFEEGVKGDIPTGLEVSILHVEDEDMYDLLNPIPMEPVMTQESKKLLKLRWSKTCGTFVENVSRSLVSNLDEFQQLFHEAMAIRALLQLNAGRNMDAHVCHLVISIQLLAASPNKKIVIPRSTMTFVELGDILSIHSLATESACFDRLHHLTSRGERSRVELMKLVATLAEMNENEEEVFDPNALPSELFQKCTLSYLLHEPLVKGSTVWMGCFPPIMSKRTATVASHYLALLDNARRMHTVPTVRSNLSSRRGSKQNELVMGVFEEIGLLERLIESVQADTEKEEDEKEKEVESVTLRSHSLQTLSEHLEMSLAQRMDMTQFYSKLRHQVIETSGLSLYRKKKLPRKFLGDASDLNCLDLDSGPHISLQCVDGLSSGRLRVILKEGSTVIGSEHQPPNVYTSSRFVCDYHCACHNTTGNLELELLRENAEVYINGKLISNSNDFLYDNSSGGVDMLALETVDDEEEEAHHGLTLSNGLPRLHHNDWIALTPSSACMFQVVYHEEVADKIRGGNLEPFNAVTPNSVLDWNVVVFREEAIDMLETILQGEGLSPSKQSKLDEPLIYEAGRLLSVVAECNLMATYMDRDYLFEGQAKSFSFEGLSGYAAHSNVGVPSAMQDIHNSRPTQIQPRLSNAQMPRLSQHASVFNPSPNHRPAAPRQTTVEKREDTCSLWVFVDSVSDLVPDAYWTPAKLLGRVTLIRECFDYFIECGEDKDELSKKFPASVDPFYDIPTQKLVGVAYFYLNSINYLISVEETLPVVNFKGEVVGEIDVEVVPLLESQVKALEADMPVFQTEEANLRKLVGETLLLSIKMICARGLPRNLCSYAFTSFKFFLEEAPLRTGCCAARTTAPRWEQTMSLNLIINDDLVNYVVNDALEIELWAAPESLISTVNEDDEEVLIPPPLCGDFIGEEQSKEEENGTIEELGTIEQEALGSEVEKLKLQLHELKLEVDELHRENRSNGELAIGLVKTFNPEAAHRLKREKHGRVASAVQLCKEYIQGMKGSDDVGRKEESEERPRSVSPVAAIRRKLSKRNSERAEDGENIKSQTCLIS